jgi:hypothetical protein
MSKKVATIILNRNLPEVTDALCDHIDKYDSEITDIYVVESGSSPGKLSKHCSWHVNDTDAIENGLRYARGFNYGLAQLFKEGKFAKYDYFFLCCNDISFSKPGVIKTLVEEIEQHPRLGILSPCAELWGEKLLVPAEETRYYWDLQFLSWLVRREFIETIMEPVNPGMMNFFFDGSNFRGYADDLEVVIKAYANDYAAGITTKLWQKEDDSRLRTKADLMKTDPYDLNLQRCFDEGKLWMRRKYGFNNRWTMQSSAKFFYDEFMKHYPEYSEFNILERQKELT